MAVFDLVLRNRLGAENPEVKAGIVCSHPRLASVPLCRCTVLLEMPLGVLRGLQLLLREGASPRGPVSHLPALRGCLGCSRASPTAPRA